MNTQRQKAQRQIGRLQTRPWPFAMALALVIPLSLMACDRLLRARERAAQPHQYCNAHQTVDWLRRGSGGFF